MTRFQVSKSLQQRVHHLIPGGCHTYAKGDDQFPFLAPGFITHGKGCHVWDVDGNRFIEYGMGCRGVALGHAFEPVIAAVRLELENGTNFSRPATVELECAETLLEHLGRGEMCKFAKDGSTVTTAAVRLARAFTGRDRIALCSDHPFFSTDDWFIGTTAMSAGIPRSVRDLTCTFRYNDPDSLEYLFRNYPGQIAAVILEPAKYDEPQGAFLHVVQDLCKQFGAVFILDEMITGFRWHSRGAQEVYGIEADLTTYGKALANGFSAAALVGKREIMQLGGLYHDKQRVFSLSTTHGAETHSLRAVIANIRFYQAHPVVERLEVQGTKLVEGIANAAGEAGVGQYVRLLGRPSCLVFQALDPELLPSQTYRTLLMQELIKHGVLGPSLVISYSHSDIDIAETLEAFRRAFVVYRDAISQGAEQFLVGPSSQSVYQEFNSHHFSRPVTVIE